ncbi:hypothetical protein NHJ6243_009973 [Beauveria neobassiana]
MKLMTTIVMLGLAVANVVASPVIRGTSKDVFYVVYDGNEFKHIKDASRKKVYKKPAAYGVAPIPKRDCVPGDVKSEVKDKLAGSEGGDLPATPGKEVESPSSEGEAPPPKQAGPEPGDGAVAPESPKSVALAKKFSDDESISFTTTKGIIKSDIQTKVLGYKPLDPKSSSFKVHPGKVAAGGANAALSVVTEKFLADHVYTYIYSDSKEPPNSKEKTFRAKLSSTLNIQGLTIISEGAQKISAAKAVAQKSLKASKDDTEKAEIEKASVKVVKGIRAVMWNDTLRSQRDYLLGLPDALRDQSKASLKPLGEAFNDDYVKNVAFIQMFRTFYQPNAFNRFPAYPGEKPGNLSPVQSKLRIIAAHVKNAPLPLPKTFSLAYILGQSKGLEGLDPGVPSPRDYLRDQKAPMKLSEDRINFLSLFHTLKKSGIKDTRPLHLLIAIKFRKIVKERRGSGASGPDIPPLLGRDASLESTPSLAAITGLSEEIARSLPMEGEFLRYKEEGLISEKMIMAMLRLAQSWSAPNGNKGQTTDKAEI